MRREVLVVMTALLGCSAATVYGQFSEVEPNELKSNATVIAGLTHGATITGRSLGISTTPAHTTSLDYFRVSTAPAAPGIYRHRLYISSTSAGHILTMRGLSQSSQGNTLPGVINTSSDARLALVQTAANNPEQFLQWYGFGKAEQLYFFVSGTGSTSAPYTLRLESTPTGHDSLGTLNPGTIVFRSCDVALAGDSSMHIFDSSFNAIPDYKSESTLPGVCSPGSVGTVRPRLSRTYDPGTYYLAVGRYLTITNLRAPADEAFKSDPVLDFPGAIKGSNTSAVSFNVSFNVQDSSGSFLVPASISGVGTVNFFRFEVGSVCTPVAIETQPVSAEVCEGHAAMLQVSATGTAPISYQWRRNGQPVAGATSASLTLVSAQFADAGAYDVVVSNACGVLASSTVQLGVHPDGPAITGQPQPLELCPGQTATFTVVAQAHMGGPLLYQWYVGVSPIVGANAATLNFVVSCNAASAQYSCRVEEPGCGFTDSAPALLSVRNDPPVVTLIGEPLVTVECGHGVYIESGATADDACQGSLPVTFGGGPVNPAVIGEYVLTYSATDCQGNTTIAERHVFVVDSEPPVVSVSTSTGVLWSPNHELVNVGLAATITDHCDPVGSQQNVTVRVFCDEIELPDTGDGTGRHSPDAKDVAMSTLRLRSERRGNSNGRVYLIVIESTDASGNAGFGFKTIVCPGGQNQAALDLVQAQATSVLATAQGVAASNPGDSRPIADAIAAMGFIEHGQTAENGPHQ